MAARAPTPMLARLEAELPRGPFAYEPKWDGFRCLARAAGGGVVLHSRHGRPLTRYFPEVVDALGALRTDLLLDGEVVVAKGGGLDFAALLARVHPSASRVERLRAETPATFVAFDLLALGEEELAARPFAERRRRLEALLAGPPHAALQLTPATRDPVVAAAWLALPPGSGIDGVVAKADDLVYQPGRRAMVKVKRLTTVDCAVAGMRVFPGRRAVASLLLGLHAGVELRHVGVTSSFTDARRRELYEELAPLAVPLAGHPWERGFNLGASPTGRLAGSAGRWDPRTMALDWTPLAPERVCEVVFDQLDGERFRHPARLLRWRPDREARSCGIEQLRAVRPARGGGLAPLAGSG